MIRRIWGNVPGGKPLCAVPYPVPLTVLLLMSNAAFLLCFRRGHWSRPLRAAEGMAASKK